MKGRISDTQLITCLSTILDTGVRVSVAEDTEDDLVWLYVNTKHFAACLRSDGLVDLTMGGRYRKNEGLLESFNRATMVEVSRWISREQIKPLFDKFIPTGIHGETDKFVDDVVAGRVEPPEEERDNFPIILLTTAAVGCFALVALAAFMAGILLVFFK